MNEKNRELLDKVMKKNLETTLSENDSDIKKVAFEEAMRVADKQIELDKIEASKDEAKKSRWVQIGLGVASILVVPAVDFVIKNYFVNKVGKIEQFETYLTTPGKSIVNSLFKFKK